MRPRPTGTSLQLEIEASRIHLHRSAVAVLLLGALGGVTVALWPLFPSLLPLAPAGAVLALVAWLLVVSRLRSRGVEDFLALVATVLEEDSVDDGGNVQGDLGVVDLGDVDIEQVLIENDEVCQLPSSMEPVFSSCIMAIAPLIVRILIPVSRSIPSPNFSPMLVFGSLRVTIASSPRQGSASGVPAGQSLPKGTVTPASTNSLIGIQRS